MNKFWGIVNNFFPLLDVANIIAMLLCYVVLYSKSGFELGSADRFIYTILTPLKKKWCSEILLLIL